MKIVDLKEIAKSRGLCGYSRLCKAELINLLTSRDERVKRSERSVEEPEVIFVEEAEQSALLDDPIPLNKFPKGKTLQDSKTLTSPETETGKKVKRSERSVEEPEQSAMQRLRVVELKEIAKSKGLCGYSKLRKAELIDLLKHTREGERPEIIFIDVEAKKKRKREAKKRKREAEKRKREAENNERRENIFIDVMAEKERKREREKERKRETKKREREAKKTRDQRPEIIFIDVVAKKKRKREAEKRKRKENRKKRESKKQKRVNPRSLHVDIDQLVKEIEESEALKRKDETLNDKRRLDDLKFQIKLVETETAFNKFVTQYKIEEIKDEKVNKETRSILEKQIKQLKKKKRKAKDGKRKRSLQKVIDGKVKEKVNGKVYDPKSFLSAVKPTIFTFLTENPDIKIQLVLKCVMSRTDLVTGEVEYTEAYFDSYYEINFQGVDVSNLYKTMTDKMLESFAKYLQNGSNWVFDSIKELQLNTAKYEPLSGSSYIKLPKALVDKKAIINMQNDDNQCFKWCITRALNPIERDPRRITKILRLQAKKLNWEGLKFPITLSQINRFEKLNSVSVNVFGYEKTEVYPLRVSKHSQTDYSHHVILLLISEGEKKHYCLIKSMSRLLSSQTSTHGHKKLYCPRCLNSFGRQDLLDKHLELCGDNEAVRIKMPEKGTCLQFKNNHKRMDVPFVIYADFESIMRKLRSVQKSLENAKRKAQSAYTEKKILHVPVSFCYYVLCSFDDKFSKLVEFTALSNDEDVAQKFVDSLEQEVKSIYKSHPRKKMIFTKVANAIYKKYKSCWMCGGGFTDKDWKVRDHCHYTGKFRGAAHNSCNIKYRSPKFTLVIFHNLSGYDAHLFIKKLSSIKGNIDCIPNNEEKYISFTKHIEVDRFTKDEKEVIVNRELRFIDSKKFMNSSLDKLVNNLEKNDFKNMEKYFNGEQLCLLKRKGVYPYEWLDSVDKLNETHLPPKKAFFSKLNGQGIFNKDYKHAQKVWKTFDMKTMRDYHNLYNKTDVLLLADVFENFRKVCKENYKLDPCWYYTAPGLAWDACLKLTKIKLELLTDPDMLLMFEKGVRGGVSTISNRHGQANKRVVQGYSRDA